MVPDCSARACKLVVKWVFWVHVLERNTWADAHAHVRVPSEVASAFLLEASTLAFISVPVVGVIDAGLRSAHPVANIGIGVPGVNDTSIGVGVGGSESAHTFTSLFAEVPAFWASNDFSLNAVLHIKVEAFLD